MRSQLLIVLVCSLACSAAKPTPAKPAASAPDFRAALDEHLSSIAARDLSRFMATVSDSDELTVILPSGRRVSGRADVEAMHRGWFDAASWKFETEVVKTIQRNGWAVALLQITYRDTDETGVATTDTFLLSVHFVLESGAWKLLYDQNTLNKPS